MVIAVLNPKGGSGKTTLATNLARALAREDGASVLIVDSDPQGTVRDWRNMQPDGGLDSIGVVGMDRPTFEKDIPSIAHGFSYIVIDGAGSLQKMAVSATKAADVVLIPVQPSAADIWAASDLVDLIKARQEITGGKPKAAYVISRQIVGTRLAADVETALAEFELPVFEARTSQRVVYAEALSPGSTVLDREPTGKAATEITRITEELKTWIHA